MMHDPFLFNVGGISRHGRDEADYDARPCSFLFPFVPNQQSHAARLL